MAAIDQLRAASASLVRAAADKRQEKQEVMHRKDELKINTGQTISQLQQEQRIKEQDLRQQAEDPQHRADIERSLQFVIQQIKDKQQLLNQEQNQLDQLIQQKEAQAQTFETKAREIDQLVVQQQQ